MDPLKLTESLAARARREAAPDTDVAEQVLERIRLGARPRERSLAVLAVGSLAAAAAFAFAVRVWVAWSDPLIDFFNQVPMVMQ